MGDVEGRSLDIRKNIFFQNKKWTNMDKTIELSDSSADGTIHLDDTNKTIDLESSVEIEDKTASDHYVTAASNTKFLETPKITSTPNVQPPPLRPPNAATAISNSTLFQDVEDEFLHDDSFAEAEEATKQSATQIEEDNNDDSAIESEKVTVDSKHQISSGTEESSTISSANDGQDEGDETDDDEDLQNLIEESSADFERKSIRRNVNWQDLKLPDTCTMLTTNQGARIFI